MLPSCLKNVASFLKVCEEDRQNFAASEAMDCGDSDTTIIFTSLKFPAWNIAKYTKVNVQLINVLIDWFRSGFVSPSTQKR